MAQHQFTRPLMLTSQFSFCGLPLRLDSYAGCAFRCTYCFARLRGGNSLGDAVRAADRAALARVFRRVFDLETPQPGIVGQFVRRRVPVHFGGMSDPFQPAELRHRVTESFLTTLAKYEYPTVISTKSKLVASEPYLSLLKRIRYLVIQFSFSTMRDHVASDFEPYSASPSELLRAMAALSESGIPTTCRWQPYIPGTSEPPEEFASSVSSAGCRHVAIEHLKIPIERNHVLWTDLIKAAGRDFYSEYKAIKAPRDGREFVLPPHAKVATILETAKAVRTRGMTFGAADNEFQYISDSGCCCSGVDQFPGFENWFKHQIGFAIRKCIGKRITYDSISREWAPVGSIDRFLNSNSCLSKRSELVGSLPDHVKTRWNNSRSPSCPTSFYGVMTTSQTTSSGNKVYKWDEDALAHVASLNSIDRQPTQSPVSDERPPNAEAGCLRGE